MRLRHATLAGLAATAIFASPALASPTTHWHGLPNDPLLASQWYLGATPQSAQSGATIDVAGAWRATTCPGVTIAVLDTGVDLDHPDLAGKLLPGATFIDGTTSADDDQGHGTEIAGVIAAATDNAIGVAGVCPDGNLLPVKVADSGGHTDDAAGDVKVAAGIRWAVDHGARVINMSLGVLDTPAMIEAVNYAYAHDVLIVAAVGNSGDYPNPWPAPANLPHVLAVGATDANGQRASYSSYGPQDLVLAPGDNVETTAMGGGYGSGGYTSIASPQVAGIAALIRSLRPDLNADQVRTLIETTARPVPGTTGWTVKTGYGLVDATAAVRAARDLGSDD